MVVVVDARCTVWEWAEDTEPTKLVSPEYVATIAWEPTLRVLIEQTAEPELSATAEQPVTGFPPLVKATVPPSGTGDTVAVKTTVWPNTDGLGDRSSAVVVAVPTVRPPTRCSRSRRWWRSPPRWCWCSSHWRWP